jgi:hypothetical protein
MSAICRGRGRGRSARVFCGPPSTLFGRHLAPPFAQRPALRWRQRLELAKRFAELGALLRREIVECASFLAEFTALRRCHGRPAAQSFADLLLMPGRQSRPMQRTLGEPVLARGAQPVPLPAQGRKHPLLPGRETGPCQRLRLGSCGDRRHIMIRSRLRMAGCRCAEQARSSQQQGREHRSAHDQRAPREGAEATAGWVATHR